MKTLEYGKTWEGFPYVSIIVEGYAFPGDMDHYLIGIDPPNYPVPAIRYDSGYFLCDDTALFVVCYDTGKGYWEAVGT